jgi:hypothetical protein
MGFFIPACWSHTPQPTIFGYLKGQKSTKKKPPSGEDGFYLQFISLKGYGGEDGIRTHVGLHPNGFQDRPVMTASVPLQCIKISHALGIVSHDPNKTQAYY